MRQLAKLSPWFLYYSSLATPVFAVDATTELFAQKGVITAEEYEKFKKAQSSQATADMSDRLKITSGDKNFSAQIGTILQFVGVNYSSDIKDSAGRDLANAGSELRRVRLSINGTLYNSWDYKTEIDFANGSQLVDGLPKPVGTSPVNSVLIKATKVYLMASNPQKVSIKVA